MKYNSVNRLSDFEFHDAWFSLEAFENNCLTVKALYLNIHKDAEENPNETDMEIANALITFKGFKLQSYEPVRGWKRDENGNFYSDDPKIVLYGEEAFICFLAQLKAGFTVFDLGTIDTSVHFIDAASKDPFFTVRFTFESVVIEWDDYKKEAWYTSKK